MAHTKDAPQPESVKSNPSITEWALHDITIGSRTRTDHGDIDALAQSIETIGLLHPVVVRPDGRLIAGARRLRAFETLGRSHIPVTIVDLDRIVLGEYAENTARKDFTYAEAVAIARELRPLEEAKAKERQREAGRTGGRGKPIASGKLPEAIKGEAADKAAKATGKKRRTLEKAEAVISAAEADPALYGDLAERLKEDDVRVDAVARELKQRQERASYESRTERGGGVADLADMANANRRFKVIYADPPWSFTAYTGKEKQRSADRRYDTSSLEAIMALPVADLADDDCALFLWTVWPELPGALDVIKAWGFTYKTVAFVWVKTTPTAEVVHRTGDGLHWGMGFWTRANTEICLLATKGNPLRLAENVHQIVLAPVGEHSVKPNAVRARIEQLLAGPYLEIFARRAAPDWTVWGNEITTDGA